MSIWRRLRAAATIGILWGMGWMATVIVLLTLTTVWGGLHGYRVGNPAVLRLFGRAVIRMFALGFAVGFGFSFIVAGAERSRAVGSLALARLSAWGGIASALFVGVLGVVASSPRLLSQPLVIAMIAVYGVVGAASAAGTLLLARRGRDLALPVEEARTQIR